MVVKQTTPTKKNDAKKSASPSEPTNHQPDIRPPRFFPHSRSSGLLGCSLFPDAQLVKGNCDLGRGDSTLTIRAIISLIKLELSTTRLAQESTICLEFTIS